MPIVLKRLEYFLLLAGVTVLGWYACAEIQAVTVQRLGRRALAPISAGVKPSRADRESGRVTGALAKLSIPRLGMSAIVLEGSDANTLRLGLGHIEGTALLGESGNVGIAGHRDSFFRPLRNVQIGDLIVLDTAKERLDYRVSLLRVVHPYETSVIGPTQAAMLTLVTCYPFGFIGQAPDRFIVRATRVATLSAD